MELSQVQSNSMQEDFLEIRGLFSKFLEKCDEFIESNREKCDEFIESNREVYLELGIKEIHLEEPEFANGETKDELQLGSEKATQVEPIDSVENGECSRAQFSGKLQIHLKFLSVGRVVHDFWVHNGSPKMASNARATGFIALFMKGDVLSSIFWLLVDTIWDPGGNYLNFAPNATSKVATPTKNVLGKMNEASHFSVEDWQFPFGLLISSPFFLKSFYISAYKVFGESSDPSLAIQIATVTSCAEYGVAACVFPYSYHDEACTGFEVGVHSLLEYEPREVPRIVLHVSLASNIPILLGYNPSWSDYLTTVNQLLFSQNVLPRCCLVAAMKDQNMKWVDKEGKTQLIVACMAPERSILAKTLIELVAKVNAYRPGLHAGTPLHHAAKRGLDHTVGLLLSHGANLLVRNDDGQTPLNVARSRGFVNVVRAIESHICFFSGWLREFYGPGFLEAFAPQLLSRKIWAVIVPCGSHNPLKPLKLELAIYSSLQEAQPRTVFLRLILTNSVSEDAT